MVPVHRLRWTKLRKCDGAAMVEFAIGGTVLIMFLLGIIEFGFLWYQKQIITNASREGARYGITYRKVPGSDTRQSPKNFSPSIQSVVATYLNQRIPTGSYTTTVTGTGYNAADGAYSNDLKGLPVIVTVNCTNKMDLLSGLIPSLANITFNAQTIMNCE
jgi:Flp pilus assembly protein TadG